MTTMDHVITPPELVTHPQLAALELLRTALHVSRMALYAVHPEVTADDFIAGPDDDDLLMAANLLQLIDNLLTVLPTYSAMLNEQDHRREDLEFVF
jgi:hypothetical protein